MLIFNRIYYAVDLFRHEYTCMYDYRLSMHSVSDYSE